MEFEQSSLYREVVSITNSTAVQPSFAWAAEVHLSDGTTYPFIKVLTVDIVENYEVLYSSEVFLVGEMLGGTYAKKVFPNQNQLEVTLYQIPITSDGSALDTSTALKAERFTATLNPSEGNPIIEGNGRNTPSEEVLNLTEFVTVTFQLVDKAVEKMRAVMVGGTYRFTTVEKVLRTVMTNASQSVMVEEMQRPKGVTMVPANNQTERDHIIIPQGTDLVGLPAYIQAKCGGVYGAGLGYFYKNQQWYIYPCYDPNRDPSNDSTLTIINVPRNRFQFIERTYRNNNGHVVILAAGDVGVKDLSVAFQLNQGNGTRFSKADNFIDGFGTISDNKLYVSRAANTTEVVSEQRPNKTNLVRSNDNPITSNSFVAYSKLAKGLGSILSVEWQNSQPSFIFPGMLVRFMYLDGDSVKTLNGVILKSHHFSKLRGKGVVSNQYQTMSSLYIFITRPRE